MMATLSKTVLAAMAAGAAIGPVVVLRDALFRSGTDWSGNWWIVAAAVAATVGAILGAAVGTGAQALLARVQSR